MPNALDDFEGSEFGRSHSSFQSDELQGYVKPAGAGGLPDLAEAAFSQPLDQGVSVDRFGAWLEFVIHAGDHPSGSSTLLDPTRGHSSRDVWGE
jgi:hypothetical protein